MTFRLLDPISGRCRRCTNRVTKEKIICRSCGVTDYTLLKDPLHCRKCQPKMDKRERAKTYSKSACISCGLVRRSAKKTEIICQGCNNKRRNLDVKCLISGCNKQINSKTWQLCKYHDEKRGAATVLRKYEEHYASPFSQNQRYMAILFSMIDWEAVDRGTVTIRPEDVRKFRAIGEFLKTHELPRVLSWQAIEDALPKLGKDGRTRAKFIRSSLLYLGHQAVGLGLMQDRKSYLTERLMQTYLVSTPEPFRNHLSEFQKWCANGMLNAQLQLPAMDIEILSNTPKARLQSSRSLLTFFTWCSDRGIVSLEQIEPRAVEQYKQMLFWQLECKKCHKRIPFESSKPDIKCLCATCGAISSFVRVRRLSRPYVDGEISILRVFFDWALLHKKTAGSPIPGDLRMKKHKTFRVINKQGRVMEVAQAIRRYDESVIEKCCAYIVSPHADPEAALVLYLIIFHLFTSAELRDVRIPSLVTALPNLPRGVHKKSDYEFLYLPARKPTRGKRCSGRPSEIIMFPNIALGWLVPLLERFYEKRRNVVTADHHEYLLAMKNRARHNQPVSGHYVLKLVQRSLLRIVGGVVNLGDLQRTAAAVVAETSKRRGATLTRMGYRAVRATQFNYLETHTLQPRIISLADLGESKLSENDIRLIKSIARVKAEGAK